MSDIVIVSTDTLIGAPGKQGDPGAPGATQSLWYINNLDEPYFGFTDTIGTWLIRKLDNQAGTVVYATINNNPSVLDYVSAWGARESLVYGISSEAL